MGRLEDNPRGGTDIERFFPSGSTQAPAVARFEPGKPRGRLRRAEVIALFFRESEKLSGHQGAHAVDADVLCARVAAAVTIETGQRVKAARFKFAPQDILRHQPFEHVGTSAREPDRGGSRTSSTMHLTHDGDWRSAVTSAGLQHRYNWPLRLMCSGQPAPSGPDVGRARATNAHAAPCTLRACGPGPRAVAQLS